MIIEIQNIIDNLDSNGDALLIGLLKEKIKQLNNVKIGHLKNGVTFTEKELRKAKRGSMIILRNFIASEYIKEPDKRTQKANFILDKNECKDCEYYGGYWINYGESWVGNNNKLYSSSRCKRCENRKNIFHKIAFTGFYIEKISREAVEMEELREIINLKTILNKLNKKFNEKF